MTTITTPWDRKVTVELAPDDRWLLTVEQLNSGEVVRAALTADHARTLAAALSPSQAGQWTRDDLPAPPAIRCVDDDTALDTIVTHLNTHHPKPQPYDQGGVRGADSLLYRAERAERERDAAVAHAEQAENARDTATTRAEQLEREIKRLHKVIDEKVREANESADYQEQIDAELRSAGVRVELTDPPTVSVPAVIPPVSRADVAEALARCLNPEMWDVTFPAVVNEICDLFGIEAEAVVDPVEAKAQELWEVVKPSANATWSGTGELAKEQFRRVAAHVLGQEADQ